MNEDIQICYDCGQKKTGDLIFHHLYCYDVYIVSAPCPQNAKQREIDIYMCENVVNPFEQQGFNCYHGSRNITGGEYIIQAMSYPITIVPTTIVPVFKDNKFSTLRNLLLRPDYLDRIVFLLFDSTQVYPCVISKNSYSLSIKDVHLLPKLIQTIEQNRSQIPLHQRKMKYEMGPYPESSITSIASEICKHKNSKSTFEFFKIGRLFSSGGRRENHDFRNEQSHAEETSEKILSSQIQHGLPSRSFSTNIKIDGLFLEDLKSTTCPNVLLSHCHHYDEKISHFAAKTLTKIIQKNIVVFYKNVNLQNFETEVRILVEKDYMKNCEMNCSFEKLYFWILAAIYIRIYKCNDGDLKTHMKALTLRRYRASQKPFDQLYQNNYLKLTISLYAKIKFWPYRLEKNDLHVQMLENCISLLDQKDFGTSEKAIDMNTVVKYLIHLPWDIKHIFVVIITEKIFEKKYTHSSVCFFYQICDSVREKHWEIYLDVVERATEYIQENYTKGALDACLKLLATLWDFLKGGRRKDAKLMTILKHFFKKLVYHPVNDVRKFIAPLLFSEDVNGCEVSQLGSRCIKVDEELVKTCIREKLSHNYPNMILRDQVPTTAKHVFLLDATMPDGDILVHLFKQKTLNDILQTNSTDSAHESFQEMSRAVTKCQGHNNVVTLKNLSSNYVLPMFVVEHGKSLLQFLHENENQLTWLQMIGILTDVTKAVQHCHNNNVILCDITPASFIVTPGTDGSFNTKLASFLYAKSTLHEEFNDPLQVYTEGDDFGCIEGDCRESFAAYFSAPETLTEKIFSKYTEIWMLAATYYSVLLYGRQPFEELAHLNTSGFVREGYLDVNGAFIQDKEKESPREVYTDYCKRDERLHERVSVRMSPNTMKIIKILNHANILPVEEILSDTYTTTLVSFPFGLYSCTLKRIDGNITLEQLLSYLEQIVSALKYLHSRNILHCDLRCSHIYVNSQKGTLQLGHFGRAVYLKKDQDCALKMMPSDAKKWSAPEVEINGMYSQASDIFNLAIVFWEAFSTQDKILSSMPLQDGSKNMKIYENLVELPDTWKYCINTLMECMTKCWNPNPTKRPTLDYIGEIIKQLKHEEHRWSDQKMLPIHSVCQENIEGQEENKEETYEVITSPCLSDFNFDNAWHSVVYEFLSVKGIEKNTSILFNIKETYLYQNVGIDWSKSRKNTSIIL